MIARMFPRLLERRIVTLLAEAPAVAILGPRQVGKTTLALELADRAGGSGTGPRSARGAGREDRGGDASDGGNGNARVDGGDAVPAGPDLRAPLYLDLEAPSDRVKLTDAESYLERYADRLVILDEIHRAPELFQTLRGLIDQGRRRARGSGMGGDAVGSGNGRFLVLGSAALDLLRQSGETLAGRIAYAEMFPLTLPEVMGDVNRTTMANGTNGQAGGNAGQGTQSTDRRGSSDPETLDRLWLRGGFPDSYTARSDAASMRWRRDFIRTYLTRDIPQFGPRIAEETLRRFWTMLAHQQGGLLNAAALARSLGVDGKTVASYLDLLVDLLLVRRLRPWHANAGKRLVKSPKVYVRDSGIAHALLDIGTTDDLLAHPVAGGSWEGFVIENILALAPEGTNAHFYRTGAGAEIDLVIEFGRHRWAIEIKRSSAPKLTRGFHVACEDIEPTERFVVYPGREAFPMGEGIEAVPLGDLLEHLGGHAVD